MIQSRTHTCNELTMRNIGEKVKIVGWMENVREVSSSLAFVVLRDFYGTTQAVIETEDMMSNVRELNKESTISVQGTVRERASKNPKLFTGDIEIVPDKIEVLGRCHYNELPFQINHSREADETTRLKYRYLDLRNPEVKNNIVLRCNVVSALRKAMEEHGFLEITTPILTASSPEGARDYLLPSRKHPGKFYALPQAPQQFKQLLMASGIDRYFQIAPCFRDEDARADRSPGEFYQLDMEMAFASQDDVFSVLEDVLPPIFSKYGKYDIASVAPFKRIAYKEAMETYGSDKPDLRIDLTIQDATELLQDCGGSVIDLQMKSDSVFAGAAVFIRPLVCQRGIELIEQISMSGVDFHTVETGLNGSFGCFCKLYGNSSYIVTCHLLLGIEICVFRRPQRRASAKPCICRSARMVQLSDNFASVPVDCLCQFGEALYIRVFCKGKLLCRGNTLSGNI